jgi:uncharacterized protein (TIGR00369 family)
VTAPAQTAAGEVTRMVEVVFPQHLNHHGNLFGGQALRMMDTAAFTAATRRARRTMMTVAVENVRFVAPVRHGEIVEMIATVPETGRTSVTVDVEMLAEALLTGERRQCGTARFVLVAVDDEGRPTPIADAT